jgi:hypothetical protein
MDTPYLFRIFKALLPLMVMSACGTELASSSGEEDRICRTGGTFSIQFRSGAGASASQLTVLSVLNQNESTVHIGSFDECGNYVGDLEPDSLTVVGSGVRVGNRSAIGSQLFFDMGAVNGTSVVASYGALTATIPVQARFSVSDAANLNRWFRADSVSTQTDGTLVGTSAIPVPDLGRQQQFI